MEIKIIKIIKGEDERVVFEALEDCNLWPYILFDSTYDNEGNLSNVHRHSYIFKNRNISHGDFVVLYTGKGDEEHFKNKRGTMTHVYYWGFDMPYSLWNKEGDRALLVKVSEYKHTGI